MLHMFKFNVSYNVYEGDVCEYATRNIFQEDPCVTARLYKYKYM